MWNSKLIRLALLAVVLCNLSACKSLQQAAVQKRQASQIRALLASNARTCDSLDARCSLLTDDWRVSGQLSIGPGSIWLSVQPLLGIETHRFHWHHELLQFLDRSQKAYVSDSLSQINLPLEQGLPLLRSLLINQISHPDGRPYALEELDYSFREDGSCLLSYRLQENVVLQYIIDEKGDFSHFYLLRDEACLLDVSYSVFTPYGEISFPVKISIKSSALPKTGSLQLSLSNLRFDCEPKHGFPIPRNYTKIEAKYLLRALINLL